jgi:hypothetical protein
MASPASILNRDYKNLRKQGEWAVKKQDFNTKLNCVIIIY